MINFIIKYSPFFVSALIIILSDAFHYGFVGEYLIKKRGNPVGVFGIKIFGRQIGMIIYSICPKYFNWLMLETPFGNRTVPKRYRVFQKLVEIGCFMLVAWLKNWLWNWNLLPAVALTLTTHYFLMYDYGYYIILGQWKLAKSFVSPFWLIYEYTAGFWALQPYSFRKFSVLFLVGIICLLVQSLLL